MIKLFNGITNIIRFLYSKGSDAPCTNAGGHCQDDHLACHNGHYQSGMCSGGAHRRCCLTSASHTGSFSTGKDTYIYTFANTFKDRIRKRFPFYHDVYITASNLM